MQIRQNSTNFCERKSEKLPGGIKKISGQNPGVKLG